MAFSRAAPPSGPWLRKLLEELGFPQKEPTDLFSDDQGSKEYKRSPHTHTKHIALRYHAPGTKHEQSVQLLGMGPRSSGSVKSPPTITSPLAPPDRIPPQASRVTNQIGGGTDLSLDSSSRYDDGPPSAETEYPFSAVSLPSTNLSDDATHYEDINARDPLPLPPPYSEAPPSASRSGGSANSTSALVLARTFLNHRSWNPNGPDSAPAIDPTTSAPLPENLQEIIQRNPQLLRILGVAIVFDGSPSVLQISRAIGLECAEVGAALKPISSYLDDLDLIVDSNSTITLCKAIEGSLLRRVGTFWIDPAKYHSQVAQWCLVGRRTLDIRDITYASKFWAYHVCNSNPSPELYDALKSSWIPLDPVSRAKLAGIIFWLKEDGGFQAQELLTSYQEHYNKVPEQVQVMNGKLEMFF
ncbi:hypothetical protein DFH08DRAFT_967764 [Mycena albidolilacea]|uniref:Uncharacterized protein n=1 Tax=Mycena albidolilacea TaxID=1033008 RepID=A0AAD6ZLP0_9AGAR|nr:hypothetical protein DFH08DRAFT_967764 [Mycena albidolilacea]